uniref:Uncharacterized protein n=1 Tax=Anguilla anguilla TaxID=7936 RepID=A0A0E9UDH1_ANGAN
MHVVTGITYFTHRSLIFPILYGHPSSASLHFYCYEVW